MNQADQASLRRMLESVGSVESAAGVRRPGAGGGGGFSVPYTMEQEAVTAHKGVKYNSMAHSFAGMCVQFILFMGIDAGMVVLYQRRSGLWKRMQAAPISRYTVIGSRAASAAIVAMIDHAGGVRLRAGGVRGEDRGQFRRASWGCAWRSRS